MILAFKVVNQLPLKVTFASFTEGVAGVLPRILKNNASFCAHYTRNER